MAMRIARSSRGISAGYGNYVPAAEGLLSGLERGIGLYNRLIEEPKAREEEAARQAEDRRMVLLRRSWEIQDRQRAEEDRQKSEEAAKRKELAAAQAAADVAEEQQLAAQLKDVDSRIGALSKQAQSAVNFYGQAVPAEIRAELGKQFAQLARTRDQVLGKITAFAERKAAAARAAVQRLSSAQAPGDADPQDVLLAVSTTGLKVGDLLRGQDGSPSNVEAALRDVAGGVESGDSDAVARAANVLLRPHLMRGVGQIAPDGTPITSKEIVRFVPHPSDPKLVSPVLLVRTAGNPQGYIAPLTEQRSTDPNDVPKWVKVDDLLEHADRLRQLVEMVNAPELAARLRSVAAQPGDGGLDPAMMFGLIPGIGPEALKQAGATERAQVKGEAAKEVAEVRARATVSAAAARAAGRGAGGAAAGGAGKQKPARMTRDQIEAEVAKRASEYGLFKQGNAWMQKDAAGRAVPASADSMLLLARLRGDVSAAAAAGAIGAPLPPLPRSLAEVEEGAVYVAPDGRVVSHLGQGKFEVLGRVAK